MVIFAIVITVLLIIVALVIDYGFVRNTRQDSKVTSDAAASAGINALAPDATPRPWPGVCEALGFVQANEPDSTFTISYTDGAGGSVGASPCTSLANQVCSPNTPSTWAWIRAVDGNRVIDIRSGYVTPDPNFPEDASEYAGDNGEVGRGGCDQLAVIVADRDSAPFGGIVGVDGYDTAIRTVARIKVSSINTGVPAFLMLERRECATLAEQVGASEGGIIVERSVANTPGIIHVDSAGVPCIGSNGNNKDAFVVFSDSPPTPGIRIDGATAATKGILSMYALSAGNTTNAWSTPSGISADVVSGGVISRTPVDDKYNPSSNPTIKNLHEATVTLANATTTPAGYTPAGGTCTNRNGTITGVRVFVNCPGGLTVGASLTFPNATHIVFNGPVDIGNNKAMFLPAAQSVVVGGTTADGGLMVNSGGRLGINSTAFADNDAAVRAACNAPDGPTSNVATLVVFGGKSTGGNTQGAVNIGGRAAICKTTGYLAGPKTLGTHNAQSLTDGTYHSTCVPATPCPLTTASNVAPNAYLAVSGGFVRWTAPNRLNTTPAPGSVGTEDLAIWTESPTESYIKSGGVLDAQGVFFFPNASVQMSSPADFTPRDAQFIARKLLLLQGTLQMRPTPANNVQIEILDSVSLVR